MYFERVKKYLNNKENFALHNGLVVTVIKEKYSEVEAEITPNGLNPQGMAHGGLIFTLCDVATGVAAVSTGRAVLTLNSSINFLAPGRGKKLRAVGECIKDGRTIGLFEARVYDESDKLIAKGDFTIFYTGDFIPE